jgi:hypothetical protein
MSTARVTKRAPKLEWQLAAGTDGARVDLCADRGCTYVLQTFDAVGATGAPSADLPAGVAYWRAYGRSGDSVGCTPSPVWEFFVNRRNADGPDTSWGTVNDVNEDGYADLSTIESVGGVIYYGAPAGPSTTPSELVPCNPLIGAMLGAGDVDGDGFGDVATIGIANNVSSVAIRRGSPNGTVAGFATVDGIVLTGGPAPLGDVNRDGYGDVGFPQGQIGGFNSGLQVYYGSPSGLDVARSTYISNPGPPSIEFGYARSAGDVNADGYADVIVGYEPADYLTPGLGLAFVYLGGPSGIGTTPATTLHSPPQDHFGIWVNGGGDVNGDGYADVLVAALNHRSRFHYRLTLRV